jgi:hypothetical protein
VTGPSQSEDLWEAYRLIAGEVDRYRDWPIRILTFTSALHFALIAALAATNLSLGFCGKLLITLLLTGLTAFTLIYFRNCHCTYLRLRNSQVRLNKRMDLENLHALPRSWFNERRVSIWTGFWGWGFYLCYAVVLWAITLMVIWELGLSVR